MITLRTRMFAILIGLLAGSTTFPPAQTADAPVLEFVESVPAETVLDDPAVPEARGVWPAMIAAARRTLDIEQFYISDKAGEALDTVLSAVVEAVKRSVRVRCIVDARMFRTSPEAVDRLRGAGVHVRTIDFRRIAGGVQHAKFFIVDNETVFLGSQNFDWRALSHIRELGLRIRHPEAARFVRSVFETDWALAADPDTVVHRAAVSAGPFLIAGAGRDTIRLVLTGSPRALLPDTGAWDEEHLVRLIDGARREVCLQFLSYERKNRSGGDFPVLDEAIRRAAARGASVKMIVSDWAKATPAEADLKALAALPRVEIRFSAIPEWSGGYIPYARVEHCKFVLVDGGRFWLGTSNAGESYFRTSRNLGAVVESDALGAHLRSWFHRSWDGPYVESVVPGRTYRFREHGGE